MRSTNGAAPAPPPPRPACRLLPTPPAHLFSRFCETGGPACSSPAVMIELHDLNKLVRHVCELSGGVDIEWAAAVLASVRSLPEDLGLSPDAAPELAR